jgi:hypothetical protein
VTWAAFVIVVSVVKKGINTINESVSSLQKKKRQDNLSNGERRMGRAYLGYGYLEIQAGGGSVPLYLEPSKNLHHPRLRRRALWRQRDQEIVLVVRGV